MPKRTARPPGPPTLFPIVPKMDERAWQSIIQRSLTKQGYRWQHVYRTRMQDGSWRTSTTAIGWPDLMAFRRGWVLGIECKSIGNKATTEQREWLTEIAQIPTGRAWVLDQRIDWQLLANWINRPESAPRIYGWEPSPEQASALALTV